MKQSVAAIILFSSIATSFAGTPIPNNKVVQDVQSCSVKCQNNFTLCVQLRGTQFVPPVAPGSTPTTPPAIVARPAPGIGPNCEMDQDLCLRSCQVNPRAEHAELLDECNRTIDI